MQDWVTVSEASQRLDISERSVRTWIAEGKLNARKHGRKWLIAEESMGVTEEKLRSLESIRRHSGHHASSYNDIR